MIRLFLSFILCAGLIGCAQSAKKADATPESKATDSKTTENKVKPAESKAASTKDTKAKKAEVKTAATPAAPAEAGTVSCASGADKRTITVKTVGQGCEVMYDKNGTVTSPGSAKHGTEYCTRIQGKIKDNLVKAGLTCN